jgi:hypothetical protein
MATVGVIVLSFDGMKQIPHSLESVAWADRVLLLHAGGDPPVGREFPALSVRRLSSWSEAEDYVAEIGTDWVLWLWGDEQVDPLLAEEIRGLQSAPQADCPPAYKISVRSFILGRWVNGGIAGPSPSVRLFRGMHLPHGWWMSASAAGTLSRGSIEDRGTEDLSAAVDRVQSLSDFWTARLMKTSAPPGALRTILISIGVKMRVLFDNGFFARGLSGIALAGLASYSVLLSGAKFWEARHVKGRSAVE